MSQEMMSSRRKLEGEAAASESSCKSDFLSTTSLVSRLENQSKDNELPKVSHLSIPVLRRNSTAWHSASSDHLQTSPTEAWQGS